MSSHCYTLTILNHRGKRLLTMRVHAVMLMLLPLTMVLLLLGNIFLVKYLALHQTSAGKAAMAKQTLLLQSERLLENAYQINSIQRGLSRVMDFNAKLRIMLEIAEPDDLTATLSTMADTARGLQLLPSLYGRNLNRRLWEHMDEISGSIVMEEIRQQEIAHAVSEQLETLGSIPVIIPVQGRFSSPFGWRIDPFTGKKRFHKGVDLVAPTGTPIRTTANGVITKMTRSSSYGLVIEVTHNDKISTLYAHMSGFAVEKGQRVLRGQVIGYIGNTGRSKAPHLHYEVHVNGKSVNPLNYILQ